MVQYWIYKNVAFIFALFFYGFYCAFSGTAYYDAWILTGYNVLFTSLPPLFYGFFEQDISAESTFRYPKGYLEVQCGRNFTLTTILVWIAEAFYVSIVCYFCGYGVFVMDLLPDGTVYGIAVQGNAISIYAITVVNLRILLETRNLSWVVHLGYWICFGFLLLVMGVETTWYWFSPAQYGVFEIMAGSGIFWLLYLLVVVMSLAPAIFWKGLSWHLWPWDAHIIREAEKWGNKRYQGGGGGNLSLPPPLDADSRDTSKLIPTHQQGQDEFDL